MFNITNQFLLKYKLKIIPIQLVALAAIEIDTHNETNELRKQVQEAVFKREPSAIVQKVYDEMLRPEDEAAILGRVTTHVAEQNPKKKVKLDKDYEYVNGNNDKSGEDFNSSEDDKSDQDFNWSKKVSSKVRKLQMWSSLRIDILQIISSSCFMNYDTKTISNCQMSDNYLIS